MRPPYPVFTRLGNRDVHRDLVAVDFHGIIGDRIAGNRPVPPQFVPNARRYRRARGVRYIVPTMVSAARDPILPQNTGPFATEASMPLPSSDGLATCCANVGFYPTAPVTRRYPANTSAMLDPKKINGVANRVVKRMLGRGADCDKALQDCGELRIIL